MSLADNISQYIAEALKSDDTAEKLRIIGAFYDRTMNYEYEIVSAGLGSEFVARGPDNKELAFTYRKGTFRLFGKIISQAELAEILRLPVAYLCGLVEGAELMQPLLPSRSEAAKREFEANTLLRYAKEKERKAKKMLAEAVSSSVLKAIRRNVEKNLAKTRLEQYKRGLTKKAIKHFNETCSRHNMPEIPVPKYTVAQVKDMPSFPGVYFEWDGLMCAYVGESASVPKRLASHTTVNKSSLVSFIETKEHKLFEHYYIWLLNPYKNKK